MELTDRKACSAVSPAISIFFSRAAVLRASSSAPGLRCVEIEGKPVGRQAPEMVGKLQKWVRDEIFAATEPD